VVLKNSWLFPVIQSVHLVGIALLVGTVVLVDLRLLGYVLGRYTVSEVSRRFERWTRSRARHHAHNGSSAVRVRCDQIFPESSVSI